MSSIPADAAHWDSGDWIDWHRNTPAGVLPSAAPSADPNARLHALRLRMLCAARTYTDVTGKHLPIYDGIARIHAALAFDMPPSDTRTEDGPVQIIALPPDGCQDIITVDLAHPFCCLVVVRITPAFESVARMLPRSALPDRTTGCCEVHWNAMSTVH